MRIVVRSSAPRAARQAQDYLAAAGVEAMAVSELRPAPDGQDIVIIPALDGEIDEARALARTARADGRPLAIVLGARWTAPPLRTLAADPDFDGAIALDAPAPLLAAQITAVTRVAISVEEGVRRSATAAELDTPTPTPPEPKKLRALYVGAPSPLFLKLEHAFAQNGGIVAAAFSSFTGFDHLHDGEFDAVVLNGAQNPSTAVSLCAALRRNATLVHLPTLVLVKPDDASTAMASIERGASAVATTNVPSGPAMGWLFEAIRRDRKRRSVETTLRALRDLMGDARTGLWLRPAFVNHLSRLAITHHESGRPLALCVLRVLPAHGAREPSAQAWKKGFSEISSLAGRLMREADSAAAIGGDLVAVALPATDVLGAKRNAERIASVSECTAFASGDDGAGPLVFEQSAVELQPGESGAGMLARALRDLQLESIPA